MSKKILVVDDDKGQVSMYDSMLSQRGYQVMTAYDGEQAIDKVGRVRPDLIIMDVQMPKMDGDAAYMTLKADEKTKSIPVLIVTGLRTEEELAQTKEPDTFAKPVKFECLLERIRQLIGD